MKKEYAQFAQRRRKLVAEVKDAFDNPQDGIILFFAGYEHDRYRFRQESSLYYFTGINEPAVALAIDMRGKEILYVPQSQTKRAQWVDGAIEPNDELAKIIGFSDIAYLGQPVPGYHASPLFLQKSYENLIARCEKVKGPIFTCFPETGNGYIEQRQTIDRLCAFVPSIRSKIKDISSIVAAMRRKKSQQELELLRKAIDITIQAHRAAAKTMGENVSEAAVQAEIEKTFIENGASTAFPSIVGSGKKSTVLHYQNNHQIMQKGDLVVVDIGAEYQLYCADITRTYPVSGRFSTRQKEIYTAVLEAQALVAKHARPGMWLINKEQPQKSLHHLAVEFFRAQEIEKYFIHGIGHFLGLDVHDVGDVTLPLQAGDVITIEPGLYILEENIGIRIEDDYLITENGAECLSENLPKSIEDIEKSFLAFKIIEFFCSKKRPGDLPGLLINFCRSQFI